MDSSGLCWENQLKQAQQEIDWALDQLTKGGFPNANSPLLSVDSPLGKVVSQVYTGAQNNRTALLAAAGGAAGFGAQATAIGTSSVGFVFSSAGVATFGAGAVNRRPVVQSSSPEALALASDMVYLKSLLAVGKMSPMR